MKTTSKLFLALFAAAILGSTLTVVASNYYVKNEDENFIHTSTRIPSSDTDFTIAAENTINCVVSIKTFANTQRQQYQGNRYFDPFEFFFGPGYGNNTPHKRNTPTIYKTPINP